MDRFSFCNFNEEMRRLYKLYQAVSHRGHPRAGRQGDYYSRTLY